MSSQPTELSESGLISCGLVRGIWRSRSTRIVTIAKTKKISKTGAALYAHASKLAHQLAISTDQPYRRLGAPTGVTKSQPAGDETAAAVVT
jgi:hypothetical protein